MGPGTYGKGKGADALKPFWKRLWGSHAKIKAVAMDLSPTYQQAVSKYLPKAKIVFDHFHVIKLFNEKLSDLRRNLFHRNTQGQASQRLALMQSLLHPLALSGFGRKATGGRSGRGERAEMDAFDRRNCLARIHAEFRCHTDREGPLVKIVFRSVFPNSDVGGWQ